MAIVIITLGAYLTLHTFDKRSQEVCNIHCKHTLFGLLEGGPILFLLSPEVSGTSGTMSIYIYI